MENLTRFEVREEGTLRMANFFVAETRADLYEAKTYRWDDSPSSLIDCLRSCEPFAWEVHSLYSAAREDLMMKIEELKSDLVDHGEQVKTLLDELRSMPEEPEYGIEDWLGRIDEAYFKSVVVEGLREWFLDSPDPIMEDDFVSEATPESAAKKYFEALDAETLGRLGVVIVDGEFPGSSYYAAELRCEIDVANAAAEQFGIAVWFVSYVE